MKNKFFITMLFAGFVLGTVHLPMANALPEAANGFDDFDDDTAGLIPTGEFYEYVENNPICRTTNTDAYSGTNSVVTTVGTPNTACGTFHLKPTGTEFCANQRISSRVEFHFRVRMEDTDTTWGGAIRITDGGGSGSSNIVGFSMSGDGGSAVVTSGANAGNAIPDFIPAKNTWYEVVVTGIRCAGVVTNTYVTAIVTGEGASAALNNGWTLLSGNVRIQPVATFSGTVIFIDDLRVTGFLEAVGAEASTDAWTGFNLVGFDVDYNKKTVIARLEGDGVIESSSIQQIYTFDPITLNVINTMEDGLRTDGDMQCSFVDDGVIAVWDGATSNSYVGFTNCAQDVDRLQIRNSALGDPELAGTLCVEDGNDFCVIDLFDEESPDGHDCPATNDTDTSGDINPDTAQIGQIIAVPISYTNGIDESNVHDFVNVGFTYSTTNLAMNKVGTWVQSQINDDLDISCYIEKDYTANDIKEICAFRGNKLGGSDYVTAVGLNSNAITWNLTFTRQKTTHPFFDNDYFTPNMAQVSQLQTGIQGVGCSMFSNSSLFIDNTGEVNRYNVIGPNLGAALWDEPLTDGITALSRGVTMSRDGNWGAYATDDDGWVVFNATDGTPLATGTLPSGDYFGMRLSGSGNELFIATNEQIARYHVTEFTNKNNVPDDVVCDSNGQNCLALNDDGTIRDDAIPPGGSGGKLITSGSGCNQHWDGEIEIGATYVPLGSWSNCASMAFETAFTVLFMAGLIGFLQWKIAGGTTIGVMLIAGGLGAFASVFLWQFPLWPFIVVGAVAVAFGVLKAVRGSPGTVQ